jgi:hypothetical protein
MRKGDNTKSVSKDLNNPRLDRSAPIKRDKFSMQLAMEPYNQLGTGERCKIKGCAQPVYDNNWGLCSYHRMQQEEQAFENRLKARQQHAVIERNND